MENSRDKSKPLIFIFDGPVSCSKLFRRLISTHPSLQPIHGYPYLLAATRGPEQIPVGYTPATQQRLFDKWKNEIREEDLKRWQTVTFDQANNEVKTGIEKVKAEGKIPIVQEHAAICIKSEILLAVLRDTSAYLASHVESNPTVITEDFLHRCLPVILVRHPALFIPSFYRKQKKEAMLDLDDEAFQMWISLDWVRMMYEYLSRRAQEDPSSRRPVVVDAEDLVNDTENLMSKLCAVICVEPTGIQYSWDNSNNEDIPEGVTPTFHERLRKSTGIERDHGKVLDKDIDLDQMAQEWIDEFGGDVAKTIQAKVNAEMPTYWYLQKRKL